MKRGGPVRFEMVKDIRGNGAPANPKATVRDIARITGVSASTVSRVLSNGSRSEFISEETRRKVRDVAAQLGYSPNPLARALKGGHSNLIGLILREIADPFFAQLTQELSNCAQNQGYQIVLGYARGDPDQALKMSAVLDTRHVDGVIILGDLRDDEKTLSEILANNPAAVALCRTSSPPSLFTITTDNTAGIQVLFDHLYGLGHRKIGFLQGNWLADIAERREAFLELAQAKNLRVLPEWTRKTANRLAGGYQAMQTLLSLPERPTAVMASDDTIAVGAMKAALDAGLRVPQNISITGYDDIEIASYTYPGLTTVHQPIDEMAGHAIQALVSMIRERQKLVSESRLKVQPQLVIRDSTGTPSKG